MSSAIPIKNLYYLLCYAWDVLPQADLIDISNNKEAHPIDLLAEVLIKGTNHLLRRGIDQDYLAIEQVTGTLKGRIDFATSQRRLLLHQGLALCSFDEISSNTLPNQILRASLSHLYRTWGLDKDLRKQCGLLVKRLHCISDIPFKKGYFSRVRLHRNNRFYRFLLNVCELILTECLPDESVGTSRFRDFFRDEGKMARLYEKFIFNFYCKKQSEYKVSSDRITWDASSVDDPDLSLLPSMLTDISLRSKDRSIIIDAKYYQNTLNKHFDKYSIHSSNLYQICTYLQNIKPNGGNDLTAEGVLLYPVVSQSISMRYQLNGSTIRIETLDLAADWAEIESKLHSIIS